MSDETANDQAVPTTAHDEQEINSKSSGSSNSSNGHEKQLEEASDQEQRPSRSCLEIADSFSDLERHQTLLHIAETNQVQKPWEDIRQAIKDTIVKQCEIMESKADEEAKATIEGSKTNIMHSIDHHKEAPFTVQRLCELVTDPRKHYRMFNKYMNAIEKVLLVTSSWKEYPEHYETNGATPASPEIDNDVIFGIPGITNGAELEPIPFAVDKNGTEEEKEQEQKKESSIMTTSSEEKEEEQEQEAKE